ncbi:MAG: o-succinylbenzoate synthase [Bdellovibrionota bacterium]
MTLLPYKLNFIDPIYIRENEKLESKNGFIIKVEKNNIISFADVSPLQYLNLETYDDVYQECKKIDINRIFEDIDFFLKTKEEFFIQEKFLDFDFSKYTKLPSLKHGLSCLFSDHYRQKLKLKISGDVYFHGLIPNRLTQSSQDEVVKRSNLMEKNGFKKAKLKIGSLKTTSETLKNDNNLIKKILAGTTNLQLRLDANKNFKLEDFPTLLDGIDLKRIDYVEEPVSKSSDLVHFTTNTKLSIAIDENIHLMKDIIFEKVSAVIIKPTLLGDYYTLKRLIQTYSKRGISAVFSSCFESQVGIYQIAQLAHVFNPQESHGLDTFDCYLESLMDLNVHSNAITLQENIELKGPIYI